MRAPRYARGGRIAVLCLVAAMTTCACTSGDDGEPAASESSTHSSGTAAETEPGQPAATGDPTELDVLVYNVEYGGNASTDKVIRSLDADVVGVLESYNRLPEIAKNAGYPYYDVGLQLLSKYPILEPAGANGLYALIEVQPGYAIAFFNTHLDYVAYGPRLLAQGMPVNDVIASEDEVRTSSLQLQIPQLADLADEGYPVVLTGDFNEPSSLDYTAETVGSRPGITEVVRWPVSEALFDIGFRDTFRDIHPDPTADPGITWPGAKDGGDRIDYIYTGGPVETTDSLLIGERGGQDVDRGFEPWTSDHRAVLSTLDLTPVALPTTVALDRRMLTEGDKLTVYYNAPGSSAETIDVLPEGGAESDPLLTEQADDSSGSVTLQTASLEPGGYRIVMLGADGDELARNEFWVRSTNPAATINTDRARYDVGEPITVRWDDGPANRWDWISIFRASASDPGNDDFLLWGYTGGHNSGALPPSVSGSMTFDASSEGHPWPLPPGRYVVHYLLTDQYVSAGRTTFTVVG